MARFRLPWTRGEKFSDQWSIGDPAFAAWWHFSHRGELGELGGEIVTPYTILGLSGVLRAVSAIASTIAGLPLRTYERDDEGNKTQIPSEFDDPYPGDDGLTPFSWVETLIIHLLLWRQSYLWHEARGDGSSGLAYRPVVPDAFIVRRINGHRQFQYTPVNTTDVQMVGAEQVTYIPGPSVDGFSGHPLIWPARAMFSAALSGDKTAEATMRRGIRLGGLITPGDNEDDIDPEDMAGILEGLRATMVGREHSGDIAAINKRVKLQPWAMNNVEAQWAQTKEMILGDIERFFGIPPHLMADTERQTSWGTGVQEQNLGFARYTLMGWTSRIEQVLSRRLPANQFVEFDYHGLLQGTPAEEIALIVLQMDAGLLTQDEGRQLMNRPPLTPAQQAKQALRQMPPAPPILPTPPRQIVSDKGETG